MEIEINLNNESYESLENKHEKLFYELFDFSQESERNKIIYDNVYIMYKTTFLPLKYVDSYFEDDSARYCYISLRILKIYRNELKRREKAILTSERKKMLKALYYRCGPNCNKNDLSQIEIDYFMKVHRSSRNKAEKDLREEEVVDLDY